MAANQMSSTPQQNSVCPFCGFLPSEDPYELLLVRTVHHVSISASSAMLLMASLLGLIKF